MLSPLLQAEGICCSRNSCENSPPVQLESLHFACRPGTLNLILGDAFPAPNLFLRILGLLEKPDSGEVYLNGTATSQLNSNELAELRSHRFGYVFPELFLLPSLGVCENVAMPLFKISGANIEDARRRTRALLDFVGMGDAAEFLAGELPRFDQHRLALARALVHQPEVLILENPSLPEIEEWLKLVRAAASEFGIAAIASGADERLASHMDCVFDIRRGSLAQTGQ